MRTDELIVDDVRRPVGSFKPYEAFAVSARSEEVGFTVTVEVSDVNVRGAIFAC